MFFNSTETSDRKLNKARFTKRRPSKIERKRKRKAQRVARRLNRKQKQAQSQGR